MTTVTLTIHLTKYESSIHSDPYFQLSAQFALLYDMTNPVINNHFWFSRIHMVACENQPIQLYIGLKAELLSVGFFPHWTEFFFITMKDFCCFFYTWVHICIFDVFVTFQLHENDSILLLFFLRNQIWNNMGRKAITASCKRSLQFIS